MRVQMTFTYSKRFHFFVTAYKSTQASHTSRWYCQAGIIWGGGWEGISAVPLVQISSGRKSYNLPNLSFFFYFWVIFWSISSFFVSNISAVARDILIVKRTSIRVKPRHKPPITNKNSFDLSSNLSKQPFRFLKIEKNKYMIFVVRTIL